MKNEENPQFQYQQLLHRLSKEERERLFTAAFYQQSNPYYPWFNPALIPPTSTTDVSHPVQPKSPSSDDSGNQSNSGSTTEW